MRARQPYSTASRTLLPNGLSGRDVLWRIANHPEHETGDVERGYTRRHSTSANSLDLFCLPQWHREARCAEPRFAGIRFVGASGRGDSKSAKAVCSLCPVRSECLEDALAFEAQAHVPYGVRGGMSATERRVILARNETGTVYFGRRADLIKIGMSRVSVEARAKRFGLTIVATEPGGFTRERELHLRFASDLVWGREWFRASEQLLGYISGLNSSEEAAA